MTDKRAFDRAMYKVLQEVLAQVGGARALSRAVGISHNAVLRWRKVPPLRVLELERLTGISRYRMRPDVFGAEKRQDVA